jgi:hypothetical protein
MYNGKDSPICIIRDTVYNLPSPITSSRPEFPYTDETVYIKNIYEKIISIKPIIYFEDTYIFAELTNNQFHQLVQAKNEGLTVIWIPYSDQPSLRFKCHIIDVRDIPVGGTSRFKHIKVHVRGIENIKKIPTTDNMYQVQNLKLIRI